MTRTPLKNYLSATKHYEEGVTVEAAVTSKVGEYRLQYFDTRFKNPLLEQSAQIVFADSQEELDRAMDVFEQQNNPIKKYNQLKKYVIDDTVTEITNCPHLHHISDLASRLNRILAELSYETYNQYLNDRYDEFEYNSMKTGAVTYRFKRLRFEVGPSVSDAVYEVAIFGPFIGRASIRNCRVASTCSNPNESDGSNVGWFVFKHIEHGGLYTDKYSPFSQISEDIYRNPGNYKLEFVIEHNSNIERLLKINKLITSGRSEQRGEEKTMLKLGNHVRYYDIVLNDEEHMLALKEKMYNEMKTITIAAMELDEKLLIKYRKLSASIDNMIHRRHRYSDKIIDSEIARVNHLLKHTDDVVRTKSQNFRHTFTLNGKELDTVYIREDEYFQENELKVKYRLLLTHYQEKQNVDKLYDMMKDCVFSKNEIKAFYRI